MKRRRRSAARPSRSTPAEAASLAAALKAVDESRWADARAAVANFRNTLLDRYVDWSILRVAPKTEASFANTWRFLRESPDWPEPEVLRRQAEDRIGPETPPSDVFRYFTAFPPLTSTGHMRRMEAAQAASPNDLKKFASDSWRSATFRNADENEFLNRYGHLLSGEDQIARFDRLMLEGKAPVARDLVAKLPPDYQPLANARLAMATKAADAVTVLRGVPAGQARRARDPARARAMDAPHRQPRRCEGAARQAGRQPERCVVERAQPGRARSFGRRPRRRRLRHRRAARPHHAASPSPRPSSWPAGSRCAISRRRPRPRSISRRCMTA